MAPTEGPRRLPPGKSATHAAPPTRASAGTSVKAAQARSQHLATGCLLALSGFAYWDLGMPMDYKGALGARSVSVEPSWSA
jgi:hypothetical protein